MATSPDSERVVLVNVPYSEQVSRIVRRSILSGQYEAGQRLNEAEISATLGISRSPVREGLRKLVDEGLVVLKPGRGTFVASFDISEVRGLLEFREALDVMGARLAAERASSEQIESMQRSLEAATVAHKGGGPVQSWASDFHILILRASGNQRIADRGTEAHTQLRLARFRSGSSDDRAQEAHDEHQAILDAIRARDPQAAAASMHAHLQEATCHILRVLHELTDQLATPDGGSPPGRVHVSDPSKG